MAERSDEAFWDQRYRSHPTLWSGSPNSQLVTETEGLPPGSALDAGCGEGSDAIWLAGRGWRVTAVDISGVALQRGITNAESVGAEVAARIEWRHEDLTTWDPGPDRFDLVTSQFLHLPSAPREALFARLAAATAPGGTLLLVGHHPSDMRTTMPRPRAPDLFFTGDEIGAQLDPDDWAVVTNVAASRTATDPEGRAVIIHDTVLRARRRG